MIPTKGRDLVTLRICLSFASTWVNALSASTPSGQISTTRLAYGLRTLRETFGVVCVLDHHTESNQDDAACHLSRALSTYKEQALAGRLLSEMARPGEGSGGWGGAGVASHRPPQGLPRGNPGAGLAGSAGGTVTGCARDAARSTRCHTAPSWFTSTRRSARGRVE